MICGGGGGRRRCGGGGGGGRWRKTLGLCETFGGRSTYLW